MTLLEWQSRMKDLKSSRREWPPWDLLDCLATEPQSLSSMEQIERWICGFNGSWCYRGHRDESWFLVSSLVRERKEVQLEVEDHTHTMLPRFDASAHELLELTEFQDGNSELRASNREDNLAKMQHYGAPTTSLDFSRSPYVALWFAMQDERLGKRNDGSPKGSVMWAIDLHWLAETGQRMVTDGDPHIVVVQAVSHPNRRMVAQQGVLLVNRSPQRTFTECLLGMLLKSPMRPKDKWSANWQ